jgi:hypothetical protein
MLAAKCFSLVFIVRSGGHMVIKLREVKRQPYNCPPPEFLTFKLIPTKFPAIPQLKFVTLMVMTHNRLLFLVSCDPSWPPVCLSSFQSTSLSWDFTPLMDIE